MSTIPHPISIPSCGSFSPFVFLFLFYWFFFCTLFLLIYSTYCPISFPRFQLLFHTFCSYFPVWCLLILLMTVFLFLSFLGVRIFSCKHTHNMFMYEGNSISKLQIVIEKNRMEIMTYKQHLFFNIISIQI